LPKSAGLFESMSSSAKHFLSCFLQPLIRYKAQRCYCLLALALLSACQFAEQENNPALQQDVYVWQHAWTPALSEAFLASINFVNTYHVFAAEVGANGKLITANIDTAFLKQLKKPIIVVIRINGQITDWSQQEVFDFSDNLLLKYKEIGVQIVGLELDHDCATTKLPAYAGFLNKLHALTAKQGVKLFITTLPTWLEAGTLVNLLEQVDVPVLQVHSVINAQSGLFDAKLAMAWVEGFAKISPGNFMLSLPTYGSRIAWNETGNISAIESENLLGLTGENYQELSIKPAVIVDFLKELRQKKLSHLSGVTWFRLPTAADQRTWSMSTLKAVITAQPLHARFTVRAQASEIAHVFNVLLGNDSDVDGEAPSAILFDDGSRCEAADAISPYQLSATGKMKFTLQDAYILKGHQRHLIGWVRCLQPPSQIINFEK
jgi:Protein of unknown function (DUF3142)